MKIIFNANLDREGNRKMWKSKIIAIEAKETILGFSQITVKVL